MKSARTMIAVAMALFLQTTLIPYVFAQMGGGMMGGQGYAPGHSRNQGYGPNGPGPGYRPSPEQSQAPQNLTPEEQKAREKVFVEEYIQRYLPDYKLKKNGSNKTE